MKVSFKPLLLGGLLFGLSACTIPFLPTQNSNQNINKSTPEVKPGEVAIIDSDIIVNEPLSNDVVVSPLLVAGRALPFEGGIVLLLKDISNQIIATSTATILGGTQNWRQYTGTLNFNPPISEKGWLEVYSVNSADNTIRDVVRLPLAFNEFRKPKIKIFFNNIEGDPELKDCSIVHSVEREINIQEGVDLGTQLLTAALSGLLAGPTEQDINNGFVSQIPPEGVQIQNIEIRDGIFYIDFNQALQAGVAGSCRVIAIRAQITQTLKQFSGVNDVVISIDGKTEEILQP